MLQIDNHKKGRRVYVGGRRLHHGTTGIIALIVLRKQRRLRLIAAAMILHDIRDFPFRDCDNNH